MSDLVDTDALRKLLHNDTAVEVIRLRQGLQAAVDEVDRLRTEVVEWKSYAEAQKRHWQVENVNRKAAEDDSARLRAELDAWEPVWRKMRDERDQARAVIDTLNTTYSVDKMLHKIRTDASHE